MTLPQFGEPNRETQSRRTAFASFDRYSRQQFLRVAEQLDAHEQQKALVPRTKGAAGQVTAAWQPAWPDQPLIPTDSRSSKWFTDRIAGYLQELANKTHRRVVDAGDPQWGLPWNSEKDCYPAWEKFIKALPDGVTIALTVPGFLTWKTDAPMLSCRRSMRIHTMRLPFQDRGSFASTSLVYGGPSHGRLVYFESCHTCWLEDVYLDPDAISNCDVAIDSDLTGLAGGPYGYFCTGTACQFHNVHIQRRFQNPNFVALRISEVSGSNQELHEIHNLIVNGCGFTDWLFAYIEAGSNVAHFPYKLQYPYPKGMRVRVPNGTTQLVDGRQVLAQAERVVMASDTVANTITLDQPIDQPIGTPDKPESLFVGESDSGVGIKIGNSFNARIIKIFGGTLGGLRRGIQMINGGIETHGVNFWNNESNYEIWQGSAPIMLERDDMEASRQHLIAGTNLPLTLRSCRLDFNFMQGNGSMIELYGGMQFNAEGCDLSADVPRGARIFDGTRYTGKAEITSTAFSPRTTKQSAGVDTIRYLHVRHSPLADEHSPDWATYDDMGPHTNARSLYYATNNTQGAAADRVHHYAQTGDGGPYVARETVIEAQRGQTEMIAHRRILGDPRKVDNRYDPQRDGAIDDVAHLSTLVLDETVFPQWSTSGMRPKQLMLHRIIAPKRSGDGGKMEELLLNEIMVRSGDTAHRYTYLRTDADLDVGALRQEIVIGAPDDAQLAIGAGQLYIEPLDLSLRMRVRIDAEQLVTYLIAEKQS